MSFGYIRSSLPLALALALCVAMPGLGQDAVWVSTEDGFFHDADNWQNLPPGESEDALFGVDETYRVTLADDVEHRWLRAEDGTITFDLDGHTYQARHGGDGGLEIAYDDDLSADLVFKNGTLLTEWVLVGHSPSAGSESAGSLTLSGVTWINYDETTNSVFIGSTRGEGNLYIIDGSQVTLHGGFRMGVGSSEGGELIVSGPGARLHAFNRSYLESADTTFLIEDEAEAVFERGLKVSRSTKPAGLIVDNATVSVAERMVIGYWSGHGFMEIKNGGLVTSSALGAHRLGYNAANTTIEVHSGGRFINSGGAHLPASRGANKTSNMTVRDGGEIELNHVTFGFTTTGSRYSYSNLHVHTGGVMRVTDYIDQYLTNNTAAVEVMGEGARLYVEGDGFFLGTRENRVEARGPAADLFVADSGELTVSNLFQMGSISTMTIDRGTVSAETLDMLVDEDGTAKLTAILPSGGTDTMITVSGEATVEEADFELALAEGFESEPGDIFTIIEAGTLTGEFNGIEEDEMISVGDYYQFRASYVNDAFTLHTMPPPGTILMMY